MKCTPKIVKYVKTPIDYPPMGAVCPTGIRIIDSNLNVGIAVGVSNPQYHYLVDITGTANQLLPESIQVPGKGPLVIIAVESGSVADGHVSHVQEHGLIALVASIMKRCALTPAAVTGGPRITNHPHESPLVADIAAAAFACAEDAFVDPACLVANYNPTLPYTITGCQAGKPVTIPSAAVGGGGGAAPVITYAAGVLSVNGAPVITGETLTDAFGVAIGYILPL
jgi:hypothetical protein